MCNWKLSSCENDENNHYDGCVIKRGRETLVGRRVVWLMCCLFAADEQFHPQSSAMISGGVKIQPIQREGDPEVLPL